MGVTALDKINKTWKFHPDTLRTQKADVSGQRRTSGHPAGETVVIIAAFLKLLHLPAPYQTFSLPPSFVWVTLSHCATLKVARGEIPHIEL